MANTVVPFCAPQRAKQLVFDLMAEKDNYGPGGGGGGGGRNFGRGGGFGTTSQEVRRGSGGLGLGGLLNGTGRGRSIEYCIVRDSDSCQLVWEY